MVIGANFLRRSPPVCWAFFRSLCRPVGGRPRSMANRSFRLAVGLSLLPLAFAFPGTASAALTLDQQQPTVDLAIGGLAVGGASSQMLAQTLTAGISGTLAEVQLPVSCDSGSDLVVQIEGVSGGIPSGAILSAQVVRGSSLVGGGAFNAIDFSSPAQISAGTQYAIVISSSGSCGIFQGPAGNSYAGGNLFFIALPNPPGLWVCTCDFAGASFDLPFKTLVNATPDVADQLADLLSDVTGLGPGTSLADKVTLVESDVAADDLTDSCSTLHAFINEVQAQTGKSIASNQASTLITAAAQIDTTLGC
jgi:hypothetical protein